MTDLSNVDSWDSEAVLKFLDTWSAVLAKHGTHPIHGKLVVLVDTMAEGIERGKIPATVGRTFIKSRLADVERLLALEIEDPGV